MKGSVYNVSLMECAHNPLRFAPQFGCPYDPQVECADMVSLYQYDALGVL